jgi:aminoglycoside 6'-N-acetyltransferase I
MDITFRRVTHEDKAEWFRMRKGIWPEAPDEYMTFDMDEILANDDYFVIFACDDGKPIGLTEAQIRDYVQEDYRGKRIAGIMTQAAENWIREKGCTEVASDTWLDNQPSIRAHLNMGYTEVERLVHYVKRL